MDKNFLLYPTRWASPEDHYHIYVPKHIECWHHWILGCKKFMLPAVNDAIIVGRGQKRSNVLLGQMAISGSSWCCST